jgi:hypothetical protein
MHGNPFTEKTLDRNVLTFTTLAEQSDEKAYWWTKSPYERLQAVELLRQINYGYDPSTARLQRVLTITQLTSSQSH